jgi:hypothetical protein
MINKIKRLLINLNNRDENIPSLNEEGNELYQLITKKTKILILGDAGIGKSTEIKQLAIKILEDKYKDYLPIHVELNTYADENIEEFIKIKIGDDSEKILNSDKSKLIFLFDEFDKVINKQLATRKLLTFIEKYNSSIIIITCRTNFYSGQFEGFEKYLIPLLSYKDIEEYSKIVLNHESEEFINQINKYNYIEIVRNPFFLDNLIHIFLQDKKIPEVRYEIIQRLTLLMLETDEKKLDKYDLKHTYPISIIEKDLMRLSLIMEIVQKNFFTIEELSKIIPEEHKRNIICELSIIKKNLDIKGFNYQFQHNNFQEFLAAKFLAKLPIQKAINLVTMETLIEKEAMNKYRSIEYVDRKNKEAKEYLDNDFFKDYNFTLFGIKVFSLIKLFLPLYKWFLNCFFKDSNLGKINPSWVNTIAFLCQLKNDNIIYEHLKFNEPELILKFEKDKIEDNKRIEVFKIIFNKYNDRNIWLDHEKIDYNQMADFGDLRKCYDFLLGILSKADNDVSKYNTIQLLGRMHSEYDDKLRTTLLKIAKDNNEKNNIRSTSISALARKYNNVETVEELKHLKDTKDDWILSGLYLLIGESNLSNKYVDLLLEGISNIRFILDSKESRLANESWNLMNCIEKIDNPEAIKRLIEYFINNTQDLTEININRYIDKIVDNIVKAYSYDKSILDGMERLVNIAFKKYYDFEANKIKVFFDATNTSFAYFCKLIDRNHEDYNYNLLASLADEKCINYLLEKYKTNIVSADNVRIVINHMFKYKEKYNILLDVINKATDKKFMPQPGRNYEQENIDKKQRELEIVYDKKEFIKEVSIIFEKDAKETMEFDDFDKLMFSYDRKELYNSLVINILRNNLESKKNIKFTFEQIVDFINSWNYDNLTINYVFNKFKTLNLSDKQIKFIEDYCIRNLHNVNFKNALKQEANKTSSNLIEIYLWYFYRTLNLSYPLEVLLDMISYDWIDDCSGYVGIDYLEAKIPKEAFKARIIKNLKEGIKINAVLKNHIKYCKMNSIIEVKDQLIALVDNQSIESEIKLIAIDAIADYPDSTEFLIMNLDNTNIDVFTKCAELLIDKHYDDKVSDKLKQLMKSRDAKIALKSSELLITKQDIDAIIYYFDYVKNNKKSFDTDFNFNPFKYINNISSLDELIKLLKFYYEKINEFKEDDFHKLDHLIMETIKRIANQSYNNYTHVMKKLSKFIANNINIKNINFLYINLDSIEREFFINIKNITLDEAIDKVNDVKCFL